MSYFVLNVFCHILYKKKSKTTATMSESKNKMSFQVNESIDLSSISVLHNFKLLITLAKQYFKNNNNNTVLNRDTKCVIQSLHMSVDFIF